MSIAEETNSPRAVGDAIQQILENNFKSVAGSLVSHYSSNFARRAMADLAFEDDAGFYYVVDVKTHNLETKFNMPNLTSVERLSRFYEDDKNIFILLMVKYRIDNENSIKVESAHFVPIEHVNWESLTIGALGWGQIQIANSNNVIIERNYSRTKWMKELFNTLLEYYPREIQKMNKRLEHFKKLMLDWEAKTDIWQ